MKYKISFILVLFLAGACSKHDSIVPQVEHPLILKDKSESLLFKIIPQAEDQLKISFQYASGRDLIKVLLKDDTTTVGEFPVTNEQNSIYSANLTYKFTAGKKYNLLVQSASVGDTAYRYTIPNYTHTYLNSFTYQKLLGLRQGLGPQAFDISPSRNFLFITDDVQNSLITKRLSLKDLTVDTIGGNINGLQIRSMSDEEILASTSTYNNRFLGNDSVAFVRYNIKTGQSTFVDFVSASYARISRVIDNHILVTNPVFTSATSSLIDLNDNSKILYPYNSFNFTYIGENNFDHIYYQNDIVDTKTGALLSKIPVPDSSGIEYMDSATQYSIVSRYSFKNSPDSFPYYKSRLSVYLKTNLVYEGDYDNTRLFQIGRQLSIKNNRLLFYQSFGFDTTFRIDGYYWLDLTTKQVSLAQCDSNPYVIEDFQVDGHTCISVRADGVYRIINP